MGQGALNFQGLKGGAALPAGTRKVLVTAGGAVSAGQFVVINNSVVTVALTNPFDGIALSSGSTGDTIKVAVLEVA